MVSFSLKYLTKNRHGMWQLRRAIPEPLRPRFRRSEIILPLNTKSEREAIRRYPAAMRQLEATWEAGKGELVISPAAAQEMADRWLRSALIADEKRREAKGYPKETPSTREGEDWTPEEIMQSELSERLRDGDLEVVADDVAEVLKAEGLTLDGDSPSYKRMAEAIGEAKLRFLGVATDRARGVWKRLDELAPEPSRKPLSTAPTIKELLAKWSAATDAKPKTKHEWTKAVERLVTMYGDLPADQIAPRHLSEMEEAMREGGKAAGTIGKQLTAIKTVLNFGVGKGYLPYSPIAKYKVPKGKGERLPFTPEQLRALFASRTFTENWRPRGKVGDAAFWLPLLGLLTGARLEELAQLAVTDVQRERGVWFLSITDVGEDQSLKNVVSRRRVPLHSELIRLGFLNYVKSIGKGALFPGLARGKLSGRGDAFSKSFGRELDRIGVKDRWYVFHSFRHGWKDAARAAKLDEEMRDALQGHSGGGVGRGYGRGFTIKELAEGMARIHFEGPDWSRIKSPWRAQP